MTQSPFSQGKMATKSTSGLAAENVGKMGFGQNLKKSG